MKSCPGVLHTTWANQNAGTTKAKTHIGKNKTRGTHALRAVPPVFRVVYQTSSKTAPMTIATVEVFFRGTHFPSDPSFFILHLTSDQNAAQLVTQCIAMEGEGNEDKHH